MKNQYNVIVIGSGPGGEGAAMKCAKEGLHVAICDYFSMIGGSCTHTNTIPSKALRHASQILYETNSLNEASFQTLLTKAEIVIQEQFNLRKSFYERNLVGPVIRRCIFLQKPFYGLLKG